MAGTRQFENDDLLNLSTVQTTSMDEEDESEEEDDAQMISKSQYTPLFQANKKPKKMIIICISICILIAILGSFFVVIFNVVNKGFTDQNTSTATEIPSIPPTIITKCSVLTDCMSCALVDECSWCHTNCIPIDDQEECILNSPGCDEYIPTTQVLFETNEKLTYQLIFTSCTHNSTYTSVAECQQQKSVLSFYVETADNMHRSYHLFAEINSMVINNINILHHFDNNSIPLCDVYVHHALVKNISCGNWSNQINNIIHTQTDANKFQSNIILTTLHELLPRLDNILYENDNENFTEIVTNGDVHIHRLNTTYADAIELNETYQLSDFTQWKNEIVPGNIIFNEQRIVNTNNKHLQNTHTYVAVELQNFNDSYIQTMDTELFLLSQSVSTWNFDAMRSNIYNYHNGYYTLVFTLQQWRAETSEFTKRINKTEVIRDNASDSVYILGSDNRRRLSVSNSDDYVKIFDYEKQLVKETILGISVEIVALVDVVMTPTWQEKPDVEWQPNGCSSVGNHIAKMTNYYNEISACCDIHDADYADCNSKKAEVDDKLIDCVDKYDQLAAEAFRIGLDTEISSIFYYRAKDKHCYLSNESVTDMIDITSQIHIKMNDKIVYEMLFMGDAYYEGKTHESHVANFGMFGGCIGVGFGDLCFDLYASILFELDVELVLIGDEFFSLSAVPKLSAGITADASFELILVKVGGKVRGDIIQASIPTTAEWKYEFGPIVWTDLVIETAVLTIDAYYQYLSCDCGCWCFCANCEWSDWQSVYEWRKIFGHSQIYHVLNWKVFPEDGDTVYTVNITLCIGTETTTLSIPDEQKIISDLHLTPSEYISFHASNAVTPSRNPTRAVKCGNSRSMYTGTHHGSAELNIVLYDQSTQERVEDVLNTSNFYWNLYGGIKQQNNNMFIHLDFSHTSGTSIWKS